MWQQPLNKSSPVILHMLLPACIEQELPSYITHVVACLPSDNFVYLPTYSILGFVACSWLLVG